ncbi:hypothetical protein SAMN05443999_10510 [Roseovarius azorensis]|uniref:Translocase n=1 Tax=Roseovarius azorensis TaxID=1287727 RepID=A0A1H7PKJ7_9RHOB|nr:hypothetical protein [Roseovarius azorensis]SEL35775.1 hypothetical protein SAMN05443999_10510 [Roseovarius azorensis]
MSKARRYITAGGILTCALGVAYFIEAGANTPVTGVSAGDVIARQMAGGVDRSGAPMLPPTAPEPAALPATAVALSVTEEWRALTPAPQEESVTALVCDQVMTAEPLVAAMVRLTLNAPCRINERFTLEHSGLRFTAVTDHQGSSVLEVPALGEEAVFVAAFGAEETAVARTTVSVLGIYDRYVVHWAGSGGVHVHAFEYGADFGEAGHVWAGARHDMIRAVSGDGGFLTSLGAPDLAGGHHAEVYTFPVGRAQQQDAARILVEAEVTDANCGRDLEVHALSSRGGVSSGAQQVVLAMPDCEAVGDFLVLKNLFNSLKITRN